MGHHGIIWEVGRARRTRGESGFYYKVNRKLWEVLGRGPKLFFFLNEFLNFEIVLDSPVTVRNNTERVSVPFAQFTPTATFCKTTGQHHNLEVDTDTVEIQSTFITTWTPHVILL